MNNFAVYVYDTVCVVPTVSLWKCTVISVSVLSIMYFMAPYSALNIIVSVVEIY